MKKKTIVVLSCVLTLILFAMCAVLAWYHIPKVFLRDVEADEISSVSVFNGSTGNSFVISETADIEFVVENLQSLPVYRDGISAYRDGFAFSMTFYDRDGNAVESLIVNSTNTIRRDPFFWRVKGMNGELCYDALCEMEEKYSPDPDFGVDG